MRKRIGFLALALVVCTTLLVVDGRDGPQIRIRVAHLKRIRCGTYGRFDVNQDGWLDSNDVWLLHQLGRHQDALELYRLLGGTGMTGSYG